MGIVMMDSVSQALVRGDGISEYERRASERYFGECSARGTIDWFLRVRNGVLRAYYDEINES
jgi:hypothetical protein